MSADYGRIARVTFVFTGLASLYPLALFLAANSTTAVQRRYAAENAAVVASLPESYVTNRYDTLDADELQDAGCATIPVVLPATPMAPLAPSASASHDDW